MIIHKDFTKWPYSLAPLQFIIYFTNFLIEYFLATVEAHYLFSLIYCFVLHFAFNMRCRPGRHMEVKYIVKIFFLFSMKAEFSSINILVSSRTCPKYLFAEGVDMIWKMYELFFMWLPSNITTSLIYVSF